MKNAELADLLDDLISMVCKFVETSSESFRQGRCVLIYPSDKIAETLGIAKKEAQRLRKTDKEMPK